MKKKIAIAAAFFVFAGDALAQELVLPEKMTIAEAKSIVFGAQITFKEPKKDFGNIKQGDVIEHTFPFENTGNLPLVISNVQTTCGCTATEWPTEPIAPGDSASITARFDSYGKKGAQQKVISVFSNSVSGKAYLSLITHIEDK